MSHPPSIKAVSSASPYMSALLPHQLPDEPFMEHDFLALKYPSAKVLDSATLYGAFKTWFMDNHTRAERTKTLVAAIKLHSELAISSVKQPLDPVTINLLGASLNSSGVIRGHLEYLLPVVTDDKGSTRGPERETSWRLVFKVTARPMEVRIHDGKDGAGLLRKLLHGLG